MLYLILMLVQPEQAPTPPQAPPVEPPSYEQMRGKTPLIVFAGFPYRKLSLAASAGEPASFLGGTKPALVLYPGDGWGYRRYEYLDDDAIAAWIDLLKARQPTRAVPFVKRRTVDARALDRVPVLREMETYERAKYSQRIYTMRNFTEHHIDRIARDGLASWTRVPGGLEEVAGGWSSELRVLLPARPVSWVGDIGIRNSFGFTQFNRGWKREFAAGTTFADILINEETGNAFEIRLAEKKEDGTWERYIAWKDRDASPSGYVGLQQQKCADCHGRAGTGTYDLGLIPGGDGVLSFPFEALER